MLNDLASQLPEKVLDPIASSLDRLRKNLPLGWTAETSRVGRPKWTHFRCDSTPLPSQGWKLHISATTDNAEIILETVLPVLIAVKTHFKVAATLSDLALLNDGGATLSQVGKFITVFPLDSDSAVSTARVLMDATRGLDGPRVPSDHPLREGSIVSYRYGAIDSELTQTRWGEIAPGLLTPAGTIEPDLREARYRKPEWVHIDPFEVSGLAEPLRRSNRTLNGRYVRVAMIHRSVAHSVYIATDVISRRVCIVKGPSFMDRLGSNRQLEKEMTALSILAPLSCTPNLIETFQEQGYVYLVSEEIPGKTLHSLVSEILIEFGEVPLDKIVSTVAELAEAAHQIHRYGVVHGDIKPSNIIIDSSLKVSLVDFGGCAFLSTEDDSPRGRGTIGYMSPQHARGERLTVQDDIFSLGAVLYFMLTGVDISHAPNSVDLLSRGPESFHPHASTLAHVLKRALAEDAADRYSSGIEFKEALLMAPNNASAALAGTVHQYPAERHIEVHRSRAISLLETICAMCDETDEGEVRWRSNHSTTLGSVTHDINTGQAGTLLALCELHRCFGDSITEETLISGIRFLDSASPLASPPLPGLYVGQAGVASAMLRAGLITGDTSMIDAAARRGMLVASLPKVSPDLFNGAAGRLRFHLWLWDHTKNDIFLDHAIECGEFLLHSLAASDDEVKWVIPEGYGGLSGTSSLGYAHGLAGIADCLLDLFEVTDDPRIGQVVSRCVAHLLRCALPSLNGDGINWPIEKGVLPSVPAWCHGATGIAQFLLHANAHGMLPNGGEVIEKAVSTVARCARWIDPTLCHGLAGSIEFLLDVYQATDSKVALKEAFTLADLLSDYSTQRDGLLFFSSEQASVITPDYMVGYAGIATTFLRLSAPDAHARVLSTTGFRVC